MLHSITCTSIFIGLCHNYVTYNYFNWSIQKLCYINRFPLVSFKTMLLTSIFIGQYYKQESFLFSHNNLTGENPHQSFKHIVEWSLLSNCPELSIMYFNRYCRSMKCFFYLTVTFTQSWTMVNKTVMH